MIIVPPKTLDFECSAPVEDLPVWGVTPGYAELPSPPPSPPVERILWENPSSGDLWCAQGYNLYKRTSGVWGLFYTFDRKIKAMTGDYARGRIYVSLYVASPSNSEICGIDHLMPAATPDSHYNTASYVRSLAVDRTTGRIYLGSVDKVEYASAIPYSGGLHTDAYGNIAGIAINSATGKLYILRTDEILIQTAFTGTYASTAFEYDAQSISVSETTGDVYVLDAGATADIYKQTAGAGSFVLIEEGTPVGDGMRVAASETYDGVYITEQDTTVPLKLFGPLTIFEKDDYSISNDRVYLSLVGDNAAEPGTDTTKWFDYGPTNPGRMFDEQLTTRTVGLPDDLYFTILGPGIDTIGLFNLTGTNAVLRVFDGTGLVATTTKAISSRNIAFNDVAVGLVYEINITGTAPACGGVVAGLAEDIGETLWGVNLELVSYSKVVLDDFGRATFTRRGRAKRATFPLWSQMADVNRLYELFNANDAKFCMWQGDETAQYLLLYGHYKRFDMPLSQLSGVKYSIEVLGDVDTQDEEGPMFATESPAFGMTRAMLCPDGRTVLIWFSRPATIGAGGDSGFSLTGGMGDLSYLAGADGIVFVFETVEYIGPEATDLAVEYTQPVEGVTDLDGVELESTGELNHGPNVENNSAIPNAPVLLSAQIDRAYLTLTFDAPVVYTGQGTSDAYFSLLGSVHGAVGLSYSAHPSPEVLVFIATETMNSDEDVLFSFGGQIDVLEDENGLDVPAITDFVCEVLVFIEPVYTDLSWPCCDKSDTSPVIACSEDDYYNGTVTRILKTLYNQTLSNDEGSGLAECGFEVANSTSTPTSIKVSKILPVGGEIHHFKVTAGFCWTDQSAHVIPYTLFHVRNAEDSASPRQLRLIWNRDKSFVLQDNGATVTPLTSSTLQLSNHRSIRDYLDLTVNGSLVTLEYIKRVQTLLDYASETTYFNTALCSWELSTGVSLTDPVLYFGGYEYQSFAPYYDLMVGACTWDNLE